MCVKKALNCLIYENRILQRILLGCNLLNLLITFSHYRKLNEGNVEEKLLLRGLKINDTLSRLMRLML